MGIGDIIVLKEDSIISQVGRVRYHQNILYLEIKKYDKFEITNIIHDNNDNGGYYIVECRTMDTVGMPIYFEPNMKYFLTEKEYLQALREDKLKEIGI